MIAKSWLMPLTPKLPEQTNKNFGYASHIRLKGSSISTDRHGRIRSPYTDWGSTKLPHLGQEHLAHCRLRQMLWSRATHVADEACFWIS